MDNQNESLTFFEKLKQIRIEKKLDLADISKKSRISIKYLEAIESGELDKIPEVYDKLFFSTYLSYFDFDEEAKTIFMDDFREERRKRYPQLTTTIRQIKPVKTDYSDMARFKSLFIALPVVLVVLIVIILALNSERAVNDPEREIQEISVHDVAEEIEKKNTPKEADKASTIAVGRSVDSSLAVFVELFAIERTWFRVIKDKADTSEYMLQSAEKYKLNADSTLEFLVGKANGLEFVINDSSYGVLGQRDEVISYLKINHSGIATKRLKQVKNNVQASDTLVTN